MGLISSYFFLLLPLLGIVIDYSLSSNIKWLFITYHKTGHEVTKKLINRVLSVYRNQGVLESGVQFERRDVSNFFHSLEGNRNIIYLHAPNMFFNWKGYFKHPKSWRVVHFIRDPYSIIISGLLYHSQQIIPEKWLKMIPYDPCKISISSLLTYSSQFSISVNGNLTLPFFHKAVKQCKVLYHDKYAKKHRFKTYYNVIRAVKRQNINDSVIIEALRLWRLTANDCKSTSPDGS